MRLSEYVQLSAAEMARQVRERTISPVELVQASLSAIAQTDHRINAWCEVMAEQAISHARQLEAEAHQGRLRGPLHGVPIGVKDLFLTAGVPTRKGSHLTAHFVPQETSPAVSRMIDAGAIMVGKNTTAESGWKAASTSPLYGVTRNPWDPARSAGGSSSGSAAAVAAGTVPISLGSDGGGSLRIPAAFCGLFSIKPTLGRVPTFPLSSSEQLSHAGALTRNVADSALALNVLKGAHPMDPNSLPDDPRDYLEALSEPLPPTRVALLPSLFGREVAQQVAQQIQEAFKRIVQMPEIQIVDYQPQWSDPIDIFDRLWVARAATQLDASDRDLEMMDPGLARMVKAARKLTLSGHLKALQDRAAFARQVSESLLRVDLLITPTVPIETFEAERDGPLTMDPNPPVPWARWTPFTYPFNLTGHPAASVPCGWTSTGMPVGLQVVGARFQDLRVLQFCAAFEAQMSSHQKHPAILAGHPESMCV